MTFLKGVVGADARRYMTTVCREHVPTFAREANVGHPDVCRYLREFL